MSKNYDVIRIGQRLWELLMKEKKLFFFNNHSKTSESFTKSGCEFEGFVLELPREPKLFIREGKVCFSHDGDLINWDYTKGEYEPLRVEYPDKGVIEYFDEVKFIEDITLDDLDKDFRLLASEVEIRNSILNERFSVAINFAKLIYDYESRMDKLREKAVEEKDKAQSASGS